MRNTCLVVRQGQVTVYPVDKCARVSQCLIVALTALLISGSLCEDLPASVAAVDKDLEESLLRIVAAHELDLPSGDLVYNYRMRTSDSFGAFVRAQELSGTVPASYYNTNTCDADVSCELLFLGQDFQLVRRTEFLRWGRFDSLGKFIDDESKKVPPHVSTFTREGNSMIVQREDSDAVSIVNETSSIGAPLVHHFLRGRVPDFVPAHRIHQYDSLGVRSLSEMIRLSRGEHGNFSLTKADEGRVRLKMSFPDSPDAPDSSTTMEVLAELDPEVAFMPRWFRATRRDKVDSGIRYNVEFSDFITTGTGKFVPRHLLLTFSIVPKHYFPTAIHSDEVLASIFAFESEADVEIARHEITIDKIEIPAKREIQVKMVPGAEIHNRILGKSFIYQGNLKALEKELSK